MITPVNVWKKVDEQTLLLRKMRKKGGKSLDKNIECMKALNQNF